MQANSGLNAENGVILKVQDLSIFYGGVPALRGVNLDIYTHQITGIIGPSGCGKTTLLRCFNRMNDLIKETTLTGKILLHGEDISTLNAVDVRRRIGMVFQRPNPFPTSIYQNIAMGLKVNGFCGDVDGLVEQSLKQVGLWDEVKDRLAQNALSLSGGQQQRLCIARAIALEPEVILMDEPCSSLDPISTNRIEALLDELKQRYTIVVITHDLQQASRIADMVAFFTVEVHEGQRVGCLMEYATAPVIFSRPTQQATREYVYGNHMLQALLG